MGEVLIDTNILVYAHQPSEGNKHAQAVDAVEALAEARQACLSAQVLGEFVSATTRGRRPILTIAEALNQMALLADAFPVFDVTRLIALEAARCVRHHHLSYYDAQIWATAKLNQVPTVFSEDFQDGQRLEGVRFVNPLVAGFELNAWTG